ncbi:peptidase family M3 [Emericellopsis atlantica]|uniref:Peptidase family M3 n=1 Tax=Emericellopsis atlantica TaxID=2614577 RepID=A0A9P7ZJ53_9HYPO|nr:peptidase family M3 [Emericellopsis atlantica]KAG9252681.1 peptidase family M3 [Emericellopsis atlantica]
MAAEEVVSTAKKIMQEEAEVYNRVGTVRLCDACFENVVRPLIRVENEIQGQMAVLAMLRCASPDQASREASDEAVGLMREAESDMTKRRDLYLLIEAVKEKNETLHFEEAKYLDSLVKSFTRSGHGRLNEDEIQLYLEKRNQIDHLRRQYNQNLRNDDGGLWLSLDELDGVPAQDLARFVPATDEGDRGDMRFVRFTRADVNAVMQYAKNPATRKKMYIILLRDENARLLGYASHAAFRLETRVAKSTEWVNTFVDELEQVLIPQGKKEMQALLAKRNLDLPERSDSMPPWDYGYYHRLVLEDLNVDQNQIAEYFPLQKTVSAMLDIFASCLQLRFDLLDPELVADAIWHEDVQVWAVWDAREAFHGEFVGYLYTDLLWRPNKHKASQNVNLQCGYVKEDGSRVYPATLLMCHFPRPTASDCALLKHSEMTSLFHELGHGMHDLVSRTLTARFHGHRMPPDFFEVPSVMLENWCWTKNELRQMSCHYSAASPAYLAEWRRKNPAQEVPPETLPDELLGPLVQNRSKTRALWFLRQLAFARFDMAVHNVSSHEECLNLDPGSIFNDIMERLRLLPNPDQENRGHPQAAFHHLVSGMDAGYYSYLCAAVFAADIYQNTFIQDPRSQTSWERYRRGILEYGGSRDEMEMLEEFLGHHPSSDYLLRSL